MRVIEGTSYPVNYEKTLEAAKREAEYGVALGSLDDIERRWVRLMVGEDYCMADIKKDTLISDIKELVRCCIVFINKVAELEALSQHRKFKGVRRKPRPIGRMET
jgi:hypothetical protein